MQGRVLIHFDGWSINHDYWARPDGPNLHGVGWAAATKKKLIPPEDSQVNKKRYHLRIARCRKKNKKAETFGETLNTGHTIFVHMGGLFGQPRCKGCACVGLSYFA